MSGWTPVPDKLKDELFRLAKRHNKKVALELYLLAQTCRRPGWDGLQPGQVRITETQVSELLGMSRGGAHKVLTAVMFEAGLVRLGPNVLAWGSTKEAAPEAAKTQSKELQTLAVTESMEAQTEAQKEAASITILQDSKERKKAGRFAPLSQQDEKTIDEGLAIIRENYPKVYHDGEPSPAFSRSLTLDRIRALAKAHGVMPILVALERYYEASGKTYFKAPQNFLGPKGPWRDYLEEA